MRLPDCPDKPVAQASQTDYPILWNGIASAKTVVLPSPEERKDMKAHRRKRPLVRAFADEPDPDMLASAAGAVEYVGSPEHKTYPSFAGRPRPRFTGSLCDPAFKNMQTTLTEWLRQAIANGQVSTHVKQSVYI